MAERPFDEFDGLGKEIDRLWSKVASSSAPEYETGPLAQPPTDASPSKVLAWEAVSMLKQRHSREARSWAEMVDAKDQALRSLRARVASLEADNAAMRGRLDEDSARVIEETGQARAQLEAAMSSFESERRQRDDEARALRALLEQARQRLAAEDARWKAEQRQWDKKEQQYLLDLRELSALASRHQKDSAASDDEARRLKDTLGEAKSALERTLAELLRERQTRAETEQERESALKKVGEAEKHLGELSKLWEEERAQWRELWDRERSTWEAQRQEFSSWEQRLRQEREKWHADLEAKEKDQLRFTDAMTQTLRETSELSERVKSALQPGGTSAWRGWSPRARALAAAAAVALLAAPPAWRYASRRHLAVESTQAVALETPTAVAFDGTLVWISAWNGALTSYDPSKLDAPVRSAAPAAELGAYRPAGLAFGDGVLWTLDAAQARVIRHKASDPQRVLAARASPGPAPTALAFDGRALWSYDAANRALYQHGDDEASVKSFALEPDVVVTAMAWVAGDLWVFDAKARRLVEYRLEDGAFKRLRAEAFDRPVLSLAWASSLVDGKRRRQLWALEGPAGGRMTPALVRYDY
jgi:hypothetical protein